MPNDTSKTGHDRKFISLEQDHEVRDWTRSLGCTEDQLRTAVKAVGKPADAVRKYLSILGFAEVNRVKCLDSAWVCEDHPDRPSDVVTGSGWIAAARLCLAHAIPMHSSTIGRWYTRRLIVSRSRNDFIGWAIPDRCGEESSCRRRPADTRLLRFRSEGTFNGGVPGSARGAVPAGLGRPRDEREAASPCSSLRELLRRQPGPSRED